MNKKLEIQKIYALSPMQEGMLFHAMNDSSSEAYFEQSLISLSGNINIELFQQSFNCFIERHDILRTNFVFEKIQKPRQVVFKNRSVKVDYLDLSDFSKDDKVTALDEFKRQDRLKGFDLARDMLIRLALIKLDSNSYKMILTFHHILMDGWCLGIILRELGEIYRSFKNNEKPRLDKPYPYEDYIKWLNKQDKEEALSYWRDYLSGFECCTPVPGLKKNTSNSVPVIKEIEFKIDKATTDILKNIGAGSNATLNTVFQCIWGILLSRYNKSDDIVFGAVVTKRPAEIHGIEQMLGIFINTIPVRIKYDNNLLFSEMVRIVQETALQSEKYDYLQLAQVQSLSYLKGSLIDHIVAYENFPANVTTGDSGTENSIDFCITGMEALEQTIYDFNVIVSTGSEITVVFNYNAEVYEREFLLSIKSCFQEALRQVTRNPDKAVKDINILPEEEKKQIITDFNLTDKEVSRNKTVHQLFEEQVEKMPDNTAVVYKGRTLTYKQLNERANQLAKALSEKGVRHESIVGIMLEPSFEMLIGILGILKAGGAYLPIESQQPTDRIQYMLEDSKTAWLLTSSSLVAKVQFEGETIDLEDPELYKEGAGNMTSYSMPNSLAYLIYTSGSTGQPKAVMIEHASLVNLCQWHNSYYSVTEADRSFKYAGFGFDASVWEIFPYVVCGASIYMIDKEIRLEVDKLNQYFEDNEITIGFLPTQVCEQFMELDNKSLRKLLTGGDKLKRFIKRNYELVNNYGPTENTVVTTSFTVKEESHNIPIGKAIYNTKVYILGANNEIMPIGVSGELCISGISLARGYYNRPELTAEKFVPNPYLPGERMYRTGDLARWLPDGNIEFQGRTDQQVKIRGNRIELGEIESQLVKIDGIKEAIVIDIDDDTGSKYLCGYLVSEREQQSAELKAKLSKNLSDFMIPTYFVQVDSIPLTPNGKVDRKALPEPKEYIGTGDIYEAPTNETQEKIAAIWKEVLGVERVGINDNFFDLGGHSLNATTLVSRLHKEFNVEVQLTEVFGRKTVKELAKYIYDQNKSDFAGIVSVKERKYYPLSSAQKRMYLINMMIGQNITYNLPVIMFMEGKLDINRFDESIKKIVSRHESFRTSFEVVDGEPVQRINKNVDLHIEHIECKEDEVDNILKNFIQPFALDKAPLLRVGLLRINKERYVLVCDMHHIISDGVSTYIFSNEFAMLYTGQILPELKLHYKDFTAWQNEYLKSDGLKKQEKYWLETFKGEIPVLNMPLDYPRTAIQSFEGSIISFNVGRDISGKLASIASKAGATTFMMLLAAYNILLSKYSGQQDIIIGSPIAGRQHADLENMIGMFVNTLALRNYPEGEKSFTTFLKEVRENSLKAYANQDYQFEELIDKLDIKRDLSRNPLFDTMLILQNMEKNEEIIEGIDIRNYIYEGGISKFDMTLTAIESEGDIWLNIEFCVKIFKTETIQKLKEHFLNILEKISNNPEIKISKIDMLSEEEKKQIIFDFNDTKADYAQDKMIHQLFEEQAERTPDNIALLYEDKTLTYIQLNEKANQLARILREKGVGPNNIVGIMLDRSLEMMIGILGVLKAGGAYLPIDPNHPIDRIRFIIEDSDACIILTHEYYSKGKSLKGEVICLEVESIYSGNCSNLEILNKPNDLAYIIYTSGSTGKPKGVLIEHTSVVNILSALEKLYPLEENDTYLFKTTYTFDVSVAEIFGWFFNGGRLAILKQGAEKEPLRILEEIEKKNVTHINFVPSMFNIFIEMLDGERKKILNKLKYIFVAGEALQKETARKFYNLASKVKLENIYGPTESTIYATKFSVEKLKDHSLVPIGKPLQNIKVYIVDKYNNLQPVGAVGELCIGGRSLARGYLNRPDLTSEKFEHIPCLSGERLYKTGDLARWRPDGNVEYLGRIDHQVKVRGFRIELGEIESQLLGHESLKEAVVVDRIDASGVSYLCAYLVMKSELSVSELREYLSKSLPEYMIPSYFISIDKMPLNSSGKIDRKALPEPDCKINTGVEYVAPRDMTEEKIISIFKNILKTDTVGIDDNFFELGGNSLHVIKLEVELERAGMKVAISDIFSLNSVRKLSAKIQGNIDTNSILSIASDRNGIILEGQANKLLINNSDCGDSAKILPNIVPFNEFLYKNCFFNLAFSVIISQRKNILSFLTNDILSYVYKIENGKEEFNIDYLPCNDLIKVMEREGIGLRAERLNGDVITNIVQALDNKTPVILSIDCYYDCDRADTYLKKHKSHLWLVYGYDKINEIFHIIERKHFDKLSYVRRTVKYKILEESYKGHLSTFKENVQLPTYYELYLTQSSERVGPDDGVENSLQKYILVYKNNILENKGLIINSLENVRRFYNTFKEIATDKEIYKENTEMLLNTLNDIINAKQVEKYKISKLFKKQGELVNILEEIIKCWSIIRSITAKYMYSSTYEEDNIKAALEMLHKICKLENEFVEVIFNSLEG